MRAALVVACLALLAACSSKHVQVNAGSTLWTGGTAAPGTTVSGSRVGLHIEGGGPVATALIVLTLFAAGMEYSREDRPFPDPRALIPGNTEPPAPLAPRRTVSEQDCAKPVDLSSGNLRCR